MRICLKQLRRGRRGRDADRVRGGFRRGRGYASTVADAARDRGDGGGGFFDDRRFMGFSPETVEFRRE